MKITNISECGSSNLLRWAINNGANIKSDTSLQALINAETFYHITIEDVNLLELFRLTQCYREKLHVRIERKAEIPSTSELAKSFDGEYDIDGNKVPLTDVVEHACNMFFNLALQMNADDDIIRHENTRLFFPMLSRHYDIDIPLSFVDLVAAFKTPEDAALLFNSSYPDNLNDVILNSDNPLISNMIMLYIIKTTSICKYDEHYEQLLRLVKYAPLHKCSDDKLYKFRLTGFSKYNNMTRGEERCSMFNVSKDLMEKSLKKINTLKTPLKVDFALQLPIQYMQLLENTYSNEQLPIAFESSMSSIIESGLVSNNFKSHEFDESETEKIEEFNNSIESYKVRINEANQIVLNSIPVIFNNGKDIDYTNTFAMLPSAYTTKAIVTLNMEYEDLYLSHYDPIIRSMFYEMIDIVKSIK